ncbi:MAG: NAD(+) synthase [Ruminococcaceae bacterium]|nr:NAD(+) synthase [Oscillospiraceae bacterium]
MKDGIFTLAAGVPALHLANPAANAAQIIPLIREAAEAGCAVLVLPELCITGCTCGDLFFQSALMQAAEKALADIAAATAGMPMLTFAGVPLIREGKLYNCAAAITDGKILGIVPKSFIPRIGAPAQSRCFSPAPAARSVITLGGEEIPFGTGLLFRCAAMPDLTVGAEIGEDAFLPVPPSVRLCAAGASVIAHLNGMPETVTTERKLKELVSFRSGNLACAYVSADAGMGESSTDAVFGGRVLIAEGGRIIAEKAAFERESAAFTAVSADLSALLAERRRTGIFDGTEADAQEIVFDLPLRKTDILPHPVPALPFIPADPEKRAARCARILEIQSHGLARRLTAAHAGGAVVAISGGLDSCLALLVTARSFDVLGWDRTKITTVTMPCYGTTSRTKSNAQTLSEELGTSFREIPIAEAVGIHFRDIGHDPEDHSVVYENSQARERTQIIMDLANATNALVIGTGDLSELALGWATYNGDHMSNYGVNAGIPKTLIRCVVEHCAAEAAECGQDALAAVLGDILDTPVSPELLPAKDGEIAQKTEDIVGPYELHDFFLYCLVRRGYTPEKIFRLACAAFAGRFDEAAVEKWLKTFCRRFFIQQFKRSCLPDGPKVGSVGFSPRGDWAMPSDADAGAWRME